MPVAKRTKKPPMTKSKARRLRYEKSVKDATRRENEDSGGTTVNAKKKSSEKKSQAETFSGEFCTNGKDDAETQNENSGGGNSAFFGNQNKLGEDLYLISKAAEKEWPLTPQKRMLLVEDIFDIAHNDLQQPGGMLISRFFISPRCTASKCLQMARMCQPSINFDPGSTISQARTTNSCSLSVALSVGFLCSVSSCNIFRCLIFGSVNKNS